MSLSVHDGEQKHICCCCLCQSLVCDLSLKFSVLSLPFDEDRRKHIVHIWGIEAKKSAFRDNQKTFLEVENYFAV